MHSICQLFTISFTTMKSNKTEEENRSMIESIYTLCICASSWQQIYASCGGMVERREVYIGDVQLHVQEVSYGPCMGAECKGKNL